MGSPKGNATSSMCKFHTVQYGQLLQFLGLVLFDLFGVYFWGGCWFCFVGLFFS